MLSLVRPLNGIMASLCVIIAALLLNTFDAYRMLLGMAVVFFTLSGAMILNDVFDFDIDLKKGRQTPLTKGQISKKKALIVSGSFFAIAALFAIFLPANAFAIYLIAATLLVLYDMHFSQIPLLGNIVVALCVSLSFIFGAYCFSSPNPPIYFLALLSFLSTLGREIAKDIEDMEADFGIRKTLPIVLGRSASRYGALFLILFPVFLSPIPFLWLNLLYSLVFVADLIFIGAAYYLFKDIKKSTKWMKYAQLLAVLAFVLGSFRQLP